MKINYKALCGLLVAVIAYDTVQNVRNLRTIRQQNQYLDQIWEERVDARRRANYLATVIDEHHIPVDDFGDIVMRLTD